MALRFFDGGALYYTTMTDKWTYVNNVGSTVAADTGSNGRWGGRCINCTSGAGVNQFGFGVGLTGTESEYIVQFAYNLTVLTGSMNLPLVAFYEGTGLHTDIRFNITNQTFSVTRNGTVLSTSANNSHSTVAGWRYCKVRVKVHDSTGTVDFIQDGVTIFALTGQDTRNGGSGIIDRIYFSQVATSPGSSTAAIRFQDIEICDTTGAAPLNAIHDETRVRYLPVTGNGDTNNFTPSAGSNWQNVDETAHNGNTDYNSSATSGHKDLFALTNLTVTPTAIYGVMVNNMVAKDDAGSQNMRAMLKTNSTEYNGASVSVSGATYQRVGDLWAANPNTATAWTASEIDALQAGYNLP